MRLNRFISDFDLRGRDLSVFDKDILNQVKNVLRLKSGNQILLADGKTNEALAEIVEFGGDFLKVKILQKEINENESTRKVILYCSLLKRENFELVAQKATEVGVAEIAPLICERTIKTGFKRDRLEKIIKEAAEQSGRGILPILREPAVFSGAVNETKENELNLFFEKDGEKLKMPSSQVKKIGIFIGPEGGWSDFEIDLAQQRRLEMTSLGKLTLRAETAAVIATYLVCQN